MSGKNPLDPADLLMSKSNPHGDDEVEVNFDDMQKSIAIGQSAVFYDDDIVLGGGIIKSVS